MPFRHVLGHARPLGLLRRSLSRGSLPPSLLFTGPDGVGKALVARAVAEAVNCLAPAADGDACGTCAACRRIGKGTHPDVITIEPEESGSTKIDQVRPAIAATAYRPFEGRMRVVVFDEADRLGVEAQNALLKSLEEPPPASVFILVTSRPEMLLATIRSRCSQLRFGRLAAGDVATFLVERHRVPADEAHAIAAVADGSPGRALESGSKAYTDARTAALGALRVAASATSAAAKLQAAATLLPSKPAPANQRETLSTRVTMLASLLRDVALLSEGVEAGRLANADLAGDLSEVSGAFDTDRVLQGFAAADRAMSALRRNASPKVVAAWLAVQL